MKVPLSFLSSLLLQLGLFSLETPKTSDELYSQIKDLNHPTTEDYLLIQNYLTNGTREEIRRLQDYNYEHVARTLKIFGSNPNEQLVKNTLYVNSSPEERENCVLVYATFNRNYPKGLERLVHHIANSDFKGHVLYQIGGWPNTEGGSLVLAHVPYAFKVSFFKEAERLGYKRAFWLDTAVVPLVSLNILFKEIEEKGYFIMGNTHFIEPYINESAANAFNLTRKQTKKIPSCSAGICGIDFTNPKGKEIIDRLYKAAFDKDAFFSSRSDQTALSIILYQMGIQDFVPISKLPHSVQEIKPDSLLLLDRGFAHHGN